MKHVVVLFVSLFSMTFLMGGSCDSGDFTTSYYCCGQDDGFTSTCTTTPKQCAASDCNTGLQTFSNGQNECAILQSDGANNNCATYARFAEYISIGCTGTFTKDPPLSAPSNFTATAGSQSVNLSWSAPVEVASLPAGSVVYTILLGTVAGGEGFLTTNVTATSYPVTGLVPGQPYFFTIAANLFFAGNTGLAGTISAEATATPLP